MRFLILFLKCYPLNQLNKDLVKLGGTLHLIKHLCHLKYGIRHQHDTSEMVQLFSPQQPVVANDFNRDYFTHYIS